MRGFGLALLATVGIAAVAVGIFAIQWVTAPARGKLQAREQIQSGSSRIQAYDHFYNLCAAVQSDEARIDSQLDELAAASSDDERDRIHANLAGVTADRIEAINEYNADARKSYTIGQFRASDLPFELPVNTYRKGDHTVCNV